MDDFVADPHVYLSTGCLHGEHEYCQSKTGQCGDKRGGRCKFCDTQCVCPCHLPLSARGAPLRHQEDR